MRPSDSCDVGGGKQSPLESTLESLVLPPERVVAPILAICLKLRENLNYSAVLVIILLIAIDIYEVKAITASSCVLLAGIPLCWGLAVYIRSHNGASEIVLKRYDIAMLSAYCVYTVIVYLGFRFGISSLHRLCIANGMMTYLAPQLHESRSLVVFFGWHLCFCSCILRVHIHELVLLTVLFLFLSVVVWTMQTLVGVAVAIQDEVRMNRQALQERTSAQVLMHRQWWGLVQRSFQGIVQLEHGRVHWATAEFFDLFPCLKTGDAFYAGFASIDKARIESLVSCSASEEPAPHSRKLLVAASGEPGWEFDCEVVDATGQKNPERMILGVRVVGEARQIARAHSDGVSTSHQESRDSKKEIDEKSLSLSFDSLSASQRSWRHRKHMLGPSHHENCESVKEIDASSLSRSLDSQSASQRSHRHRKLKPNRLCDAATQTPALPPKVPSQCLDPLAGRHKPPVSSKHRKVREVHGSVSRYPLRRTVPDFHVTPDTTVMLCLNFGLLHINVEGRGCCNLHIATAHFLKAIQRVMQAKCQPMFTPLRDWQCMCCYAVNSNDDVDDVSDIESPERYCAICGSNGNAISEDEKSVTADIWNEHHDADGSAAGSGKDADSST